MWGRLRLWCGLIAGFTFGLSSSALADENEVMLQYFHWNLPADGLHWNQLAADAEELFQMGFSSVWVPPATKGAFGPTDAGYAPYDLYDLGEFNQKGSIRTKYGTKKEFLRAIRLAHRAGLSVISDVVLNHASGADETEAGNAIRVDPWHRNRTVGPEIRIEAWTKFLFAERREQYSKFQWRLEHFSGVDWAQNLKEKDAIYRFQRGDRSGWAWEVDREFENYDYLMMADVDFRHPEVRKHLMHWGDWVVRETQVDGFRIDAAKHMQFEFVRDWARWVKGAKRNFFVVAEYWNSNPDALRNYVAKTQGLVSVFDFSLQARLKQIASEGGAYDLRRLFEGTFTQSDPDLSVPFVENHDTHRFTSKRVRQAENWFKPAAYAAILLRRDGYPCVFYLDLYGGHSAILRVLLRARYRYAHGRQHDYFDNPDVVGWTREGTSEHPKALAVVITDSFDLRRAKSVKRMFVGTGRAEKDVRLFRDVSGNHAGRVEVGADGWGDFPVRSASEAYPEQGISVWAEEIDDPAFSGSAAQRSGVLAHQER